MEPELPPTRGTLGLPLTILAVCLALVAWQVVPQASSWSRLWLDPAGASSALGPDRSDLVQRADPADLPAPQMLGWAFPTVGFEEQPVRLEPVAVGPVTDEPYAFSATWATADGRQAPVTWSPCRPIHVVVNPAGGPADTEQQVLAALGALSAATGLVFVYDGTTDEPAAAHRAIFQPQRYGNRWAPVLIAFADERSDPGLAGSVAGQASAGIVTPDGGHEVRTSAQVAIDVEALDLPPIDGVPAWISVLRHELGHVAGLGHVDDRTQLMHPSAMGRVSYADGDLAGLALLGAGTCSRDT